MNVRHLRLLTACLLTLLLAAPPVTAQTQGADVRRAAATLVPGISDSAVLAGLQFRSIGPAVMSGRISDIAVPPARRTGERLGKTVYVATAGGGVWKTTNAGVNWTPIFDQQRVSSIGAIAVAPTDPATIWVGTGEANNLRSSSWGDGIFRSADGGATWTHAGLRRSQHIARIVVHPHDANVVFVAAMGPLWGSGGERGLYRTRDGGATWRSLKQLGPYTGFTDVVLDPRDPDIIYAASYQRERKAYSFVAGGAESAIWKSTDGGESWTMLTDGLPAGDLGRIGLDIAKSQPNTIFATVAAADGGIFRSDDAGATWTRTSTLQSIPWFFGQIRVDPLNPERVYHLGVQLSVSDDGARTFRAIAQNTHADHHAMWIDPADPDHLIIGNDGGLFFSHDAGGSWDFAINMPLATFYAIGVDMRDPYWIYGGTQDNGTWGGPSRTLARSGPGNSNWIRTGGGDGFYAAIDPTDPDVVFLESQNGALRRFHFLTQESKPIRPPAAPGAALRYNWSAPLLISPHEHRTLYFGANVLFRSHDRGDTWERVSGDLTRQLDRDSLPIMGLAGPGGYGRHEGTAEFGNLSTIDESPLRKGLLYVGSDDGLVQVSRDGGMSWTRTDRFPGVPDLTYVSRVVASHHEEGTVYVTFDGHRDNDFTAYVLKSTDFGRSFTSLASGLTDAGSVYVIREHPRNPNVLVVGAEYGVFATIDGGRTWAQLRNGIAPAPVHDLVIHPRDNDLIVGTHGRGIFVLDDLTALERLADARNRMATLFEPRPALLYSPRTSFSVFGNRNYHAQNPPFGVQLTYFVNHTLPDSARGVLRIASAEGDVVRELPAVLQPGVQRIVWDLRYAPPSAPQMEARRTADDDEATPRFQQGTALGPFVAAGTYRVGLHINASGALHEAGEWPVEVRLDPQVALTGEQYAGLIAARMQAYQLQLRTQGLIGRLDLARRSLDAAVQGDSAGAGPARTLIAEIDAALAALRPVGRGGPGGASGNTQPLLNRINGTATALNSAHFIPTPEQWRSLQDAERELGAAAIAADDLVTRAESAVRAEARQGQPEAA
jgi:photosystem II stability/assembly factor-like uncharacterized protein